MRAVEVPLAYRLDKFENNYTNNYLTAFALPRPNNDNIVQGERPQNSGGIGVGRSAQQKTCNFSETGQDRTMVTIND